LVFSCIFFTYAACLVASVGDRPRGPLKQWGNPYLNSCINIS
jgi:hypothetical protein